MLDQLESNFGEMFLRLSLYKKKCVWWSQPPSKGWKLLLKTENLAQNRFKYHPLKYFTSCDLTLDKCGVCIIFNKIYFPITSAANLDGSRYWK